MDSPYPAPLMGFAFKRLYSPPLPWPNGGILAFGPNKSPFPRSPPFYMFLGKCPYGARFLTSHPPLVARLSPSVVIFHRRGRLRTKPLRDSFDSFSLPLGSLKPPVYPPLTSLYSPTRIYFRMASVPQSAFHPGGLCFFKPNSFV